MGRQENRWVLRGMLIGLVQNIASHAQFSRDRNISLNSVHLNKVVRQHTFLKSRTRATAFLLGMFVSFSSSTAIAAEDMSASQILATGCSITSGNFSLSSFWNSKMKVLDAWCDYPSITESNVAGKRKPYAYVDGSSSDPHDALAKSKLDGTGENSGVLGTAPNTIVSFGTYCNDPSPLLDGKQGDVAFSLRVWRGDCRLQSDLLPTILLFGKNNLNEFTGDSKIPGIIQISSGSNYGRAIDYFTPGGAITVLGGGNVSYALPEFAGIIVALNTALIANNRPVLTRYTVKAVLDASSDEVYMKVNGYYGIFKENQVNSLLQNPANRYYGQLVNLENAIHIALTGSAIPPSPPPVPDPEPKATPAVIASLVSMYSMLLFDDKK